MSENLFNSLNKSRIIEFLISFFTAFTLIAVGYTYNPFVSQNYSLCISSDNAEQLLETINSDLADLDCSSKIVTPADDLIKRFCNDYLKTNFSNKNGTVQISVNDLAVMLRIQERLHKYRDNPGYVYNFYAQEQLFASSQGYRLSYKLHSAEAEIEDAMLAIMKSFSLDRVDNCLLLYKSESLADIKSSLPKHISLSIVSDSNDLCTKFKLDINPQEWDKYQLEMHSLISKRIRQIDYYINDTEPGVILLQNTADILSIKAVLEHHITISVQIIHSLSIEELAFYDVEDIFCENGSIYYVEKNNLFKEYKPLMRAEKGVSVYIQRQNAPVLAGIFVIKDGKKKLVSTVLLNPRAEQVVVPLGKTDSDIFLSSISVTQNIKNSDIQCDIAVAPFYSHPSFVGIFLLVLLFMLIAFLAPVFISERYNYSQSLLLLNFGLFSVLVNHLLLYRHCFAINILHAFWCNKVYFIILLVLLLCLSLVLFSRRSQASLTIDPASS